MKAIVVISAIVGLTLVALYVVASLKGLTLSEYLDSLWASFKADIKSAQQAEVEEVGAEVKWPFGKPWIAIKPWIEM